MKKEPVYYYGKLGQEILDKHPEDVVITLMDDDNEEFPIIVHEFKPISIGSVELLAEGILMKTLESLGEDYSRPDSEYTEPSVNMTSASLVFAQAIVDDYSPWTCNTTGKTIKYTEEQARTISSQFQNQCFYQILKESIIGCDIHLRVEKKDNNGVWIDANLYDSNREVLEFYNGRDYDLFGILAEVRNEHILGPIAEPRGIPDDACSVSIEYLGDDLNLHSHTYFTYQELLRNYSMYGITKHTGMISPEQAVKLDKFGEEPTSWRRGTSNITFVYREWYSDYNSLKPFLEGFKLVASLHWKDYDPDEIRVLIAFDNQYSTFQNWCYQ